VLFVKFVQARLDSIVFRDYVSSSDQIRALSLNNNRPVWVFVGVYTYGGPAGGAGMGRTKILPFPNDADYYWVSLAEMEGGLSEVAKLNMVNNLFSVIGMG